MHLALQLECALAEGNGIVLIPPKAKVHHLAYSVRTAQIRTQSACNQIRVKRVVIMESELNVPKGKWFKKLAHLGYMPTATSLAVALGPIPH